jgi:hypothetical protein
MNTKRRIEKVEQKMKVVLAGPPVVLHEPADPEGDAAFAEQVAEAVASGAGVVVQTAGTEPRHRLPGVAHFVPNDFEAVLAKLFLIPDPTHGNKLKAFIKEISNNPLPVVKHVTDDDDEDC